MLGFLARNYITGEDITRESILKIIDFHGYIMSPNNEVLSLCEQMILDGVLIRADNAGDRNPVGDFNPSYTYLRA